MFLVHRKGLKLDGTNPTLLYGYGGFNVAARRRPSRRAASPGSSRAASMRQPTSAAAASTARSGTRPGMLAKKQNVFDDFIAAAEWLVANRLDLAGAARRSSGGSNGGLLVGAVMTQRPELFGAAVPAVGVMDMLRFHKFTIGWAWVSDYGSPDDPEAFNAGSIAYSPFHNIRKGAKYPAILVDDGRPRRPRRARPLLQVRRRAPGRAGGRRADPDPDRDEGRPRRRQADDEADRGDRRHPGLPLADPRRAGERPAVKPLPRATSALLLASLLVTACAAAPLRRRQLRRRPKSPSLLRRPPPSDPPTS